MNTHATRRITTLVLVLLLVACGQPGRYVPANGDIVFHTSRSTQSAMIQQVTHSPYSHMGIVHLINNEAYVFEAVEPVRSTSLSDWIARGAGQHYVAMRLKDADKLLTPDAMGRMEQVAERFRGKHYDARFAWSDDQLYCSELVWKIYKRALDIEIGTPQALADLDLSDPAVAAELRRRWHGSPSLQQTVISPEAIFQSPLLVQIYQR